MPGQKDSDSGKENVVNAGKYFTFLLIKFEKYL